VYAEYNERERERVEDEACKKERVCVYVCDRASERGRERGGKREVER